MESSLKSNNVDLGQVTKISAETEYKITQEILDEFKKHDFEFDFSGTSGGSKEKVQ